MKIQLSRVQKNDEQYLTIDNIIHDFNIKSAKIKLEEELQKEFRELIIKFFYDFI
jgi:hypothetical protein